MTIELMETEECLCVCVGGGGGGKQEVKTV